MLVLLYIIIKCNHAVCVFACAPHLSPTVQKDALGCLEI